MSEKYTIANAALIPAAPGWNVRVSGQEDGKPAGKKYLVPAFAVIKGEDSREVLTPVVFNEHAEGVTLAELEAELEASGFAVESTMLYCGNERANERQRR